jgi:hypothetical protein
MMQQLKIKHSGYSQNLLGTFYNRFKHRGAFRLWRLMAKILMLFQVNLLEIRRPILNMMASLAKQPIDMKLAIDALTSSKPIGYFQYNIGSAAN